jgi:uncharacterized protein (DUF736 family)
MRRRSSPAFRSPSRPRWSRSETERQNYHGEHRHFTKTEQGFVGEIVTLTFQAKNVRFVPETNGSNENARATAPMSASRDRRRLVKRSGEGRDYLSVKLDDPSFNAPIYANLFDEEVARATRSSGPAAKVNAD